MQKAVYVTHVSMFESANQFLVRFYFVSFTIVSLFSGHLFLLAIRLRQNKPKIKTRFRSLHLGPTMAINRSFSFMLYTNLTFQKGYSYFFGTLLFCQMSQNKERWREGERQREKEFKTNKKKVARNL